MTKNTAFFSHTSLQTALFVLGSAVISQPLNGADEFTFIGFLLSAVSAFLIYALMLPICKTVFAPRIFGNEGVFKRVFLCIVFSAVALFSLWCAADAFNSFTRFASEIMLPDTPAFFSVLIFALVVIFFVTRRQEDTLKFFLLAFWGVLFVCLFFFITMVSKFDFKNIFIFEFPNIKTLIIQTKPYFINPVLPLLLLPIYNSITFKKNRSGAGFTGLAVGFSMLFLTVLGSVLLFGAPLAGELKYPYSSAVSTVSIGRLFSRLDGLSYFLYFTCALCRVTVCLFVMNTCLKNINRLLIRNKKR